MCVHLHLSIFKTDHHPVIGNDNKTTNIKLKGDMWEMLVITMTGRWQQRDMKPNHKKKEISHITHDLFWVDCCVQEGLMETTGWLRDQVDCKISKTTHTYIYRWCHNGDGWTQPKYMESEYHWPLWQARQRWHCNRGSASVTISQDQEKLG